jgi:inorganic pyrophosphatase
VLPDWYNRAGEFENASELPERLREEIEQFFLSTTFFTTKKSKILGWKGSKKAASIIKESIKVYLLQGAYLNVSTVF